MGVWFGCRRRGTLMGMPLSLSDTHLAIVILVLFYPQSLHNLWG